MLSFLLIGFQICFHVKGEWGQKWCSNISKQAIDRHEISGSHKASVENGVSAQTLAEVRLRTQLVGNNNKRDAIRSAFRHVYWLAKHRVPNRLFPDLREFSILEGNNSFRSLTKKNARYLSSTFFTDALTAIGNVLRADIIANIRKSQFFSIALDETGDISVTEQLVLYVRSVDPVSGAIRVQLFDLIPLKKADGASIYKATMKSLRDAKLELKRLTNAPSSRRFPPLTGTTKTLLLERPGNSRKFLSLSMFGRRGGQKLGDISDTRWLDTDRAVNPMDTALIEVVLDVKKVAEGKASRQDPVAIGLYSQLRSVWFICCLALFLDLMPHINAVTLAFQARELDLSAVTTLVPAAVAAVRAMYNEQTPPENSHRGQLTKRFQLMQESGIELTAKRHARNPRSALAAAQATYNPRGNAPAKKKVKVGPATLPKGKRKRDGVCLLVLRTLSRFLQIRLTSRQLMQSTVLKLTKAAML